MSMPLDNSLPWLPLVVWGVMFVASRVRVLMLRRRGVRAVIVDLRRPVGERVYDVLVIGVFVVWVYLLVAEAWPLSLNWLPGWLVVKLVDSRPVKLLGAALVVAAPVLYVAALRSMGASWRIGIDREKPGPLVTTGLFACLRNPIYVAFYLVLFGSALIHGRAVFLLLAFALIALVHGIILREERFLAERYGEAFRGYCARVGRYCPWGSGSI